MRLLRCLDPNLFPDGHRNFLSEEEVSMCIWLSSGWPPQMKVTDLRARNRGDLKAKFLDAKERHTQTNGGLSRIEEVQSDYKNLEFHWH